MVGTGIEQRVSDFRAKENQLHTSLDNLRGDRKKVKEYRAIDKELKSIVRKRQNLEAALALSDGMFVHKPPTDKCGVIFEILITPGGHAEVWVSWDGGVPIVEQPELLVIDKCDYSIVSPESALFHTQEGSLEFVPPNLLKLDNSSKQSCDHTLEKSPSMTTSELYDVACFGVPCPPFSREGRQRATSDERNLFPDTLRLIRECQPQWIVIENVVGLLDAPQYPGAERATFFQHLLRQLSSCGYVGEWLILSAACFGLPHNRKRVFIIAYPNSTKFFSLPTAWAEQIRSEIESTRTSSSWRDSQSRILGNDARTAAWLDGCRIGTKGRNSLIRRRRVVLGNTICIPAATAALQRVLYLNSIAK